MANYKNRICDMLLKRKLQGVGAVLLEGPKWCGKTTTCEQLAKSVLYMGDPVSQQRNLLIANVNINELLDGETPRLIDEWQIVPKFWDAIRFRVDHSEGFGHFLLTGSVVPPDTGEISHTGTGRIVRLKTHRLGVRACVQKPSSGRVIQDISRIRPSPQRPWG